MWGKHEDGGLPEDVRAVCAAFRAAGMAIAEHVMERELWERTRGPWRRVHNANYFSALAVAAAAAPGLPVLARHQTSLTTPSPGCRGGGAALPALPPAAGRAAAVREDSGARHKCQAWPRAANMLAGGSAGAPLLAQPVGLPVRPATTRTRRGASTV